MLGFKGLPWRSVEIPIVMPKPDLTVLTGGYRKTPVLQIGADIYCDTRLIALELERRCPNPTLFPDGSEGLALALAAWSDRAFFEPGAGLAMGTNRQGLPKAVIDDRKAFFNFMDFERLEADLPHLATQLRAHADLVDRQLADDRPYLLGVRPSLVDIHAYFPLWMARANVAAAPALLAPFTRLAPWEARVRRFGHGARTSAAAAEAHAAAQQAVAAPGGGVDADDPLGLAAGEPVVVTPDDYGRVPVRGELVTLTRREIALRRHDPAVGTVVVHFPRTGYRVERHGA
ncbi:MAG: glutathione S-transferase family protein [Proteobacteria bacterium]|nr:glutathione S-transferase family protein [Pseudomonadota bacterium]